MSLNFVKTVYGNDAYWVLNKSLCKLVGIEAALVLSDLLSKHSYFEKRGELFNDMFYNTNENISEDTTLSIYAVKLATKKLKDNGIISVRKLGVPAKNYYFINSDILLEIMSDSQLVENQPTRRSNTDQLVGSKSTTNNNKENNNKDSSKDEYTKLKTLGKILSNGHEQYMLKYEEPSSKQQKEKNKNNKERVREKKPDFTEFHFKKRLEELGAEKQHIEDWVKCRNKKKATQSETALNGFIRECERAKITVREGVEMCAVRSWQSLNAKWLKDDKNDQQQEDKKQMNLNF